jgi:protein gp37
MINLEKGRYWDKPWGIVQGCSPASPGCLHCWSAAEANIRQHQKNPIIRDQYAGLTHKVNGVPTFNGTVRLNPGALDIPLKRTKPTVFAAWNDIAHDEVSDEFFKEFIDVVASCPQHTVLALTKRPLGLAARLRGLEIEGAITGIQRDDGTIAAWPLENLWCGLTVCNQKESYEKQSDFRKIPGKKFLSLEPLLSDIPCLMLDGIDALLCGGETGPHARPMHPDWVGSVRDQCAAAGVPFFFKGWGEWSPWGQTPGLSDRSLQTKPYELVKRFYDAVGYGTYKVGRSKSGRLLDGHEHNELPWRKA